MSFRSSRVSVTSIHTLFIKVLQGCQLHLSILFSSKSWRVSVSTKSWRVSVAYSHPSSFHQRSAVASRHPLFIENLVGFRCIHPSSFHPIPRQFPFASFLFFIYELEGFPLHPSILLFIYEPEGFHFTHPSCFSSTSWRVFPLHPSILFFI